MGVKKRLSFPCFLVSLAALIGVLSASPVSAEDAVELSGLVDECDEVLNLGGPKILEDLQTEGFCSGHCSHDGEKVGKKRGDGTIITSREFPCEGDSCAKERAMRDLLNKLRMPVPECTGSCPAGKTCTRTGLLIFEGGTIDLSIVHSDFDYNQCFYKVRFLKDGAPALHARCECVVDSQDSCELSLEVD